MPRRFFELNDPRSCSWDPAQKRRHIKCERPIGVPPLPEGRPRNDCYCTRLLIKAQVSALDEAVANLSAAVETELGTDWVMVFVRA